MSWEFYILIAAVAFSVVCGGVLFLATAFLAWSVFRPRTASPPQAATVPAGASDASSMTTADHLLAAYRLAKTTAEGKAATDLAVDMHATEAEAVKTAMGGTLSPKGGNAG